MIPSFPAVFLMTSDGANLEATARDGERRIAIYRFGPPAVTAGRNARVSEAEIARWRSLGHDFARRPTGGGILRHGDDLAFGVVLPIGGDSAPAATGLFIARVAAAVRDALDAFGIGTTSSGAPASVPERCFAAPVGPELLLRGEKILGLAARRIRGAILVQGSLSVGRNPELDRLILGEGPRIDLEGTLFDAERFAERFSFLIVERRTLNVER